MNLGSGRGEREPDQGITGEACVSDRPTEAIVAVMGAESDTDSGALARLVAQQAAFIDSEASVQPDIGTRLELAVLDLNNRPSLTRLDDARLVLLAASATLEGAAELDRMLSVLEELRGAGWVRERVAVVLNRTRQGISPSTLSSYIGPRVRAVHFMERRRNGGTAAGTGGLAGWLRGGDQLIRGTTLRGRGSAELVMQRILRVLLVGVLVVLLLLGVRDLLRPFVPFLASRQPPAANPAAAYPREGAEAFAIRFALAYETYDGAHPSARQKALAPYLADGADLAMGWDGNGKQSALQGLPSGIDVRDAHQAQVTVAVLIDNGRWVYLSVPVIADRGAFAIAAAPALVPPPGKATSTQPNLDLNFQKDSALSTQLRSSATTFFSAYARSSTTDLDYYSAPGVHFVGLSGAVDLAELTSLTVAQGPPGQRVAVASVRWLDKSSGASFVQPYRLELVLYADRWLVSQITPGR